MTRTILIDIFNQKNLDIMSPVFCSYLIHTPNSSISVQNGCEIDGTTESSKRMTTPWEERVKERKLRERFDHFVAWFAFEIVLTSC